MNTKKRLDKYLVEEGLVSSRNQAHELLRQGKVLVDNHVVTKASYMIYQQEVTLKEENLYVGRGAYKLKALLEKYPIAVQGKYVCDIGSSTGGFTQVLLEKGASKVWAIDVGTDQLHSELKQDTRVVSLEGTHILDVEKFDDRIELAVVDLSFISLRKILSHLASLIAPKAQLILLFKPQFEVGKSFLNSQGVVKGQDVVCHSLLDFFSWCESQSLWPIHFCACDLQGKKGNQEFFFVLDKSLSESSLDVKDIKNYFKGLL